jgi:hypothetical protein
MTSDNNDLEQQLRQNLKLRRELAAEVDKARDGSAKQSGGVAYRLGWVLYRFFLVLAALWLASIVATLVLWLLNLMQLPPFKDFLLSLVGILVLYGLGRAFRYVLSGK